MRTFTALAFALTFALGTLIGATWGDPTVNARASALVQQCDLRARVDGVTGPWQAVDPARYPELCVGSVPTATATTRPPTPTRTPTAPRTATTAPPPTNTASATQTPVPGAWYVPAPSVTWAWQLTGTIDLSARADLYDLDWDDTPASMVQAIHNFGGKVVCYLSAGTFENWRPDASQFPASVKGKGNNWPGEAWLDIRAPALQPIMRARLDVCRQKGFDVVEPDNVDGYANTTGFPLTAADQLAYNRWLASEAHARGLGVLLKNDLDQAKDLVAAFDGLLVEQCYEYGECDLARPFVAAGKVVLVAEYSGATSAFCPKANAAGYRAIKKRESLDAWVQVCWSAP